MVGRPAASLVHFPLPLRLHSKENPRESFKLIPIYHTQTPLHSMILFPPKNLWFTMLLQAMQLPWLSLLVACPTCPRRISSQLSALSRSMQMITICWVWNGLRNSYFFDPYLSIGCFPSRAIFEVFGPLLEWLAKWFLGASGILHILDDFLFITRAPAPTISVTS